MSAKKELARNLRQQEPGRVCLQANADDISTLDQSRAPRQHHETADDYVNVVAQLNDSWRVIVCKDSIQLVLQTRRGERRGRARWTGASYHLTRKSLIRVSHALCGRIDPAAIVILEALPERIGGKA